MFADRLNDIKPFRVMEILARAGELESEGHPVVHFEVGEPDFETAAPIVAAGKAALSDGQTKYTAATGTLSLRTAISTHYRGMNLDVAPERVIVTSGASGGLMLLSALLLNPGNELLITDPGYPCNEVFTRLTGGIPKPVQVNAESGFQPDVAAIESNWGADTRGALLASPSNPTGTMMGSAQLSRIAEFIHSKKGFLVVDEIYQGITAEAEYQSSLQVVQTPLYILNSFSKFFGMTGWRLGWLIVPPVAIESVTKLAQNLVICPSSIAQHAALAAFEPDAMEIHLERVNEFALRSRLLQAGLVELGFSIPVAPQGAFYIYADISHTGLDSLVFCQRLLDEYHVAVTPGADFGDHLAERYVRFAFTTSQSQIELGLARLRLALDKWANE